MDTIVYFQSVNGVSLPVNSWDDEFICVYGIGVTLNGSAVDGLIVMSIDDAICVEFESAVQEGDVLVIGGKFVCDAQSTLYFIKESHFVWDGETWAPVINYNTIELGSLKLFGNSTTADAKADRLHFKASGAIVSDNFILTLEDGIGFTVNGEQKDATVKNMSDGGGYLYFTFDGVQNGDVVKIGGTYICPETATKYVIEESEFVWNGSWGVKCEQFNVGPLLISPSASNGQDLYLYPADSTVSLPVRSWDFMFRYVSGNGITVNGEMINMNNSVKSEPGGNFFVRLGEQKVPDGAVVIIEGVFRCEEKGYEYIIEESSFVYQNGVWSNLLDGYKAEKEVALDEYKAALVEADYYETEWAYITAIVDEAKSVIKSSISKKVVENAYTNAIALIDGVAKKADIDANFAQWKADAKAELAAYKNADDYKADEQAAIAAIVAEAQASIDACEDWTSFNQVVVDAKAAMDALWTAEKWDAALAVVADAKSELNSYKSEDNYYEAEWNEIQAIIAQASESIDANIGDEVAIAEIVESAKSKIDVVKTSEQVEAEEMVVLAAKAEISEYKSEDNYNAKEWAEIVSITSKAFAELDKAMGNNERIAQIVEQAKADMDKVLTSEEADAKAFADAKADAEATIREYVNAINYEDYTEENAAQVSAYLAAAVDALEEVTTIEGFEAVIAEMMANVESVEKLVKETPAKKGCFSSVGAATGITLAAAAVAMLLKKKED